MSVDEAIPTTVQGTDPISGDGNSQATSVGTVAGAKEENNEQSTDNEAGDQKKKTVEQVEIEKEKIEQELEALKAEKVVGMIDAIEKNGQFHSHLIYLTNWQANAISKCQPSVKRMIEVFHGENKPRFIIHLVQSWGFYNSTKLVDRSQLGKGMSIGMEYDTPPFQNKGDDYTDMNQTMARLTHFVTRVILPLAERTNALILCNAVSDECILTETLMKVLKANASRWDGGPMPFTVIKIMNEVDVLYKKEKATMKGFEEDLYRKELIKPEKGETACIVNWMGFMKQSKNWKRRHAKIKQHFDKVVEKEKGTENKNDWWRGHDLDWSLGNLIVVEGLDKCGMSNTFKRNYGPANVLITSILDTYGKIPTLAVKTGATPRKRQECYGDEMDLMGWDYLVNRVNSETHVICLDVRKPICLDQKVKKITTSDGENTGTTNDIPTDKHHEVGTPAEFDKSAENSNGTTESQAFTKAAFGEFPKHENLDCCALSRLGSWMKTKDFRGKVEKEDQRNKSKTLNQLLNEEAILRNKDCEDFGEKESDEEEQCENEEVSDSKRDEKCMEYAYHFVHEFRRQLGMKEFEIKYEHEITTNIQELLMSDLFHCKNIWQDEKQLENYIDRNILFKYHRPHSAVPFEGLKLLHSAWEYVDKTRVDATGYRIICTFLFILQLTLGFLITVLTALSQKDDRDFQTYILVTTLLLTAAVSIDSLLSPKLMWRQLRLASVELESLIWKYRAGVGAFDPGLDTLRHAEDNFDEAFRKWKKNLQNTLNNPGGTIIPQSTDGETLKTSALPRVLSHLIFQSKLTSSKPATNQGDNPVDNHHSYVLSKEYLEWRLDELLKIYRERLPSHVWSFFVSASASY